MIELKLKKRGDCSAVAVCSPCPQWCFSKEEIQKVCKGKKVFLIPFMCSFPKKLEELKGVEKLGVLACGAGAQAVAEHCTDSFPLCDTRETFVKNPSLRRYCFGCGDCSIEETLGVCIYRCPKEMRNGPCGGVRNGKCEVPGVGDCVWAKIALKLGIVPNRK